MPISNAGGNIPPGQKLTGGRSTRKNRRANKTRKNRRRHRTNLKHD